MPAFLISKGYTTTTTLYEKFPNKQIAWFLECTNNCVLGNLSIYYVYFVTVL